MADSELKNISLIDVLPYKPNPVDDTNLEDLHRDLESELDKISFLTEVLRDKLYIVDDNIELVNKNVTGITDDLLKQIASEVDASVAKIDGLEKKMSDQIKDLNKEIDINTARISKEISDRAASIVKEATDRVEAIANQITTGKYEINKEAKARAEADAAEAKARIDAINAETTARTQSLAEEALKRAAAISNEASERAKAIDAEVQNRLAAYKTLDTKITEEATNRAADIQSEATKRAAAILKEQQDRGTAISEERTQRVSAIEAIATKVTTLTSAVNKNVADILSEASTRATEDSAISSRLNTLIASVGDIAGELDNYNFDNDKANWSTQFVGEDNTPNDAPGTIKSIPRVGKVLSLVGKNTLYYSRALSVDPTRYYRIRFRARQILNGNSLPDQTISAGMMVLNSNYQPVLNGSSDTLGNRFFAVDGRVLEESEGWQTFEGVIHGEGSSVNEFPRGAVFARPSFKVNGGGGDGATEIDLLDFSDVTDRELLQATISSEETSRVEGDTALSKKVDSLTSRVSSNGTEISSVANRVTKTEADLSGKASTSSVENLTASVTSNENKISSAVSRVTQVEADLNDKANITDVNNLTANVLKNASDIKEERRVRADADSATNSLFQGLSTRVVGVESKTTSNANRLTSAESTLSGKANSSDIVRLDSTIKNQSNLITSVANRVTKTESDIQGKASASDVNSLSSKVNTNVSSIQGLSTRVSSVETDVSGKASASELQALTSKVGENTSNITSEIKSRTDADTALGSRIDSVVASVTSARNELDNFEFENGKEGWSSSISGKNNRAPAAGTVKSVGGVGSVLEVKNTAWVFYSKAIPVDTSRKYKMQVKVRQTVASTNKPNSSKFYAGVVTLDSSYNNIAGGAGTHRYFVKEGQPLLPSDGWQTFEAVISGVGASHKNFRSNTSYIKPMFILNFNGGNGTAQVASVKFWDATEDLLNEAAITTETTARVTQDSALSSKIDNLVASTGANKADLRSEVLARTNADSALGTRLDTINTKVGKNASAITSEAKSRTDGDSALGSRIDSVVAITGRNTASIKTEVNSRTSADTALGKRVDAVSSKVGKNAADIKSEESTRATEDSALGKRIDTISSVVGQNTADVVAEATARANADISLGKRVDSVTAVAGSKADSSDVTALAKRVTTAEADITGKASSSSVSDLSSKVAKNLAAISAEATTRAAKDSSISKQINTISASVANKADRSTVSALSSRVTTAETNIKGKASVSSVNDLATKTDKNAAAIAKEAKASSDRDEALTSQITTLSSKVGKNTSDIVEEKKATTNSLNSLGRRVITLESDFGDTKTSITNLENTVSTNFSSQASKINTLESKVNGKADSGVVSALNTRVAKTETDIKGKASSSSVNTLSTKVGGNTSKIQTNASSINGIKSQYTIKTSSSSGGRRYISSIGLLADASNDTSEIALVADKVFFVPASMAGSYGGNSKFAPFQVIGSDTYIKSAFIRNGTIDNAKIKDATISGAKILDATIGNAKIRDLRADKITAGYLNVDRLQVNSINGNRVTNGTITSGKISTRLQSDNYVKDTSGWMIDRSTGDVEFGSGHFRGSVEADKVIGDTVGAIVFKASRVFKTHNTNSNIQDLIPLVARKGNEPSSKARTFKLSIPDVREKKRYMSFVLAPLVCGSSFGAGRGNATHRLEISAVYSDPKRGGERSRVRWKGETWHVPSPGTTYLQSTLYPRFTLEIPEYSVGEVTFTVIWKVNMKDGVLSNSNFSIQTEDTSPEHTVTIYTESSQFDLV